MRDCDLTRVSWMAGTAILLALASTSLSIAYWYETGIYTNTDSLQIHRQSANVSFTMEQQIDGTISPVDYNGRALSPYGSSHIDMMINDVGLRERTAALEGSYRSEASIDLYSNVSETINITVEKPMGTEIYAIELNERWPARLNYSRSLDYSGKGINDRQLACNTHDFVSLDMLYNPELSKDIVLNSSVERMNATILATNNSILHAEKMATRSLDIDLDAHTSGIAEISYRQVGSRYVKGPGRDYEVLNEGEERFVGVYDMTKKIHMQSSFNDTEDEMKDALPCCSGGYVNMTSQDKMGHSAEGIFDCRCY